MEDFSQYNGEGTTLRRVQLRLLDMMVEIDKICRKHNIKYWLDFGTLLGAVRHGGFIPWDDDVDISMPEEDFRLFLEIAPKELPNNLFLQTRLTEPSFPRSCIRVRDKNSLFITKNEDFSKDYHKGLFVDLFEVKPYPRVNPRIQKKIMLWYRKTIGFFWFKQDINLKNHLATIAFPIIKVGLDIIWGLLNLKKKDMFGYDKNCYGGGASYSEDTVFPLKNITFEGHTFLGPADPDCFLTRIYGDYMKIPSKEQRLTHIIHVEFFN